VVQKRTFAFRRTFAFLGFAFRLELVVNCVFWIFCFLSLLVPNCFIFSNASSIVIPQDVKDLEISTAGISFHARSISSGPSPRFATDLFAGRPLLSGRRVGKRAFHHPSFILRTDLRFKRLIDDLSKGYKTEVSPPRITATLTFLLERRSLTATAKYPYKKCLISLRTAGCTQAMLDVLA